MRIIGFSFKKITSERKKNIDGKLNIKSNIKIDSVEKDKIDLSEKETLKISFTFSVKYEPQFAEVELVGFILMLVEKQESKEILKEWKKQEIPAKFRPPIFNFIMNKCSIKAIQIEEELNLPIHIPIPRMNPNQQPGQANYTT